MCVIDCSLKDCIDVTLIDLDETILNTQKTFFSEMFTVVK